MVLYSVSVVTNNNKTRHSSKMVNTHWQTAAISLIIMMIRTNYIIHEFTWLEKFAICVMDWQVHTIRCTPTALTYVHLYLSYNQNDQRNISLILLCYDQSDHKKEENPSHHIFNSLNNKYARTESALIRRHMSVHVQIVWWLSVSVRRQSFFARSQNVTDIPR